MQQHEDAKLLAGGHSLIPILNLRLSDPGALIDIGRIAELHGISSDGNGGHHIGALTTHATIESTSGLPTALTEAASMIGDPQVRNRGTVGGNVSHADPASDLPTVMVALGATFHVAGSGGRRDVAADDFFTDLFETAMGDGEILTGVSVPNEGSGTGSAYAKLFNPASRYAMVGAAASITIEGGVCTAARVAVGGATPTAARASSVENALVGQRLDAATIAGAAAAVQGDLGDEILGDIHGSAVYRRQMATVFVQRALESAVARA
jgi:carbon-monoxide dehydrogenase medium subunit